MFLYQIFISLFKWVLPFLSWFSPSLKEFYQKRRSPKRLLTQKIDPAKKRIWFHSSSYGEFEGILPLLKFYSTADAHTTIVSFFSSSGYAPLHQHTMIDYACYLPIDTKKNMREFVKSLQADVLLISQNEYWPNMISECLALDIPIYFISSYITTGHWWLNPFALSVTKQLKEVNHIFLQDQLSYQLLKEKGFTNISHVGNTRIDQVIENTTTNKTYPQIEEFISSGQRIILAGSTLPKDERLLFQLFAQTKQLKLIIVPHEPQQFEINQLPSLIREEVCYISKFSEADKHKSILIFDSIGDLKYLYKYCDISYVGGGFDQGVHSVLEAAVFHRPIITGPNIQKFEDARNLHEMGILNTVESISELVKKIAQLKGGLTEEQGQNLSKYIAINQGATQQMLDQIRF